MKGAAEQFKKVASSIKASTNASEAKPPCVLCATDSLTPKLGTAVNTSISLATIGSVLVAVAAAHALSSDQHAESTQQQERRPGLGHGDDGDVVSDGASIKIRRVRNVEGNPANDQRGSLGQARKSSSHRIVEIIENEPIGAVLLRAKSSSGSK